MKMKDQVLVIDIGNTSTSFALYANGRVIRPGRLDTAARDPKVILARLKRCCQGRAVVGVVLCSVAPKITPVWRKTAELAAPGARVVRVDPSLEFGIPVTYPKLESIGADRLANACGAVKRYGAPVIVADFGTAVTFDVISRTKGYVGGVIAPGLPLMFTYLYERTALLPHISPGPIRNRVGKSTVEAMRMGARWGYTGMVREILAHLQKAFGTEKPRLCATGGYAGWVIGGSGIPMTVDPDLTLFGLGQIYELNSGLFQ